jgi:hypothetical protein
MAATDLLDGTTWSVKVGPTGTQVDLHLLTCATTMEAREVDHSGSFYDPAFMITAGGKASLTMVMEGPFDPSVTGLALRSIYSFTQLVDATAPAFTFNGVVMGIDHREGPDGPRQQVTVKNRSSFTLAGPGLTLAAAAAAVERREAPP